MIQIKSHFSGWHEVTAEQAQKYVQHLMKDITAIPAHEKEAYIDKHYLRGISVGELLL